jgi:hypothetical protein
VQIVLKSGSLNLLEPSGPVKACNGIALPLPLKRTVKSWNTLAAGLLASFPCKLNTFRNRVKNAVTSK